MECTFTIPYAKDVYSVFADGVFIRKADTDDEAFITLDDDYCISIFYTVFNCRRAYICCSARMVDKNIHFFNECSSQLAVLNELTGRSYDRYKRSCEWLDKATLGKFHKYPCAFFWQLSTLCQRGLNSQVNLRLLVKQYDKDIEIPWRIAWGKYISVFGKTET